MLLGALALVACGAPSEQSNVASEDVRAAGLDSASSYTCYVDGGSVGAFPVGHTSFVITTEAGRPIAVSVFYPAEARHITVQTPEAVYVMDPYTSQVPPTTSSGWEALGYDRAYESPAPEHGPFPLVMFSSGATVPGYSYLFLGTRLASHGYVVAVVEHVNEMQWINTPWDGIVAAGYHRPRDISLALTEILRRNGARGDLLFRTIDEGHLVAAGHSFGGYAAWTLMGGDDQVCDPVGFLDGLSDADIAAYCRPSPPDRRFGTVFTLDGSAQVLRFEELARVHTPSLVMGQAAWADEANTYLGPEYYTFVARPHAAMAPWGRSVRVDIAGTDHFSFTNICAGIAVLNAQGSLSQSDYAYYYDWDSCGINVETREIHRRITKYVVGFLDTQFKKRSESEARRILTQADVLANEPNVELYWEERWGDLSCTMATPTTFTYHQDMRPRACLVADKNPVAFF